MQVLERYLVFGLFIQRNLWESRSHVIREGFIRFKTYFLYWVAGFFEVEYLGFDYFRKLNIAHCWQLVIEFILGRRQNKIKY